jgi:hypothetical protein
MAMAKCRDVVGRSRPHAATSVLRSSRRVFTDAETAYLSPAISALSGRQQPSHLRCTAMRRVERDHPTVDQGPPQQESSAREGISTTGKQNARTHMYYRVAAVRSTPSPLETDGRLGGMSGVSVPDTLVIRLGLSPPSHTSATRAICPSHAGG